MDQQERLTRPCFPPANLVPAITEHLPLSDPVVQGNAGDRHGSGIVARVDTVQLAQQRRPCDARTRAVGDLLHGGHGTVQNRLWNRNQLGILRLGAHLDFTAALPIGLINSFCNNTG